MSGGITGVGQTRMSELINRFGGSDTKEKDPTPAKGSNMSETARTRMNELQSKPEAKLNKSEKRELAGLQRQYDNPGLLQLAQKAQETGGVLAGHAVALTEIANGKDVCICIRAVNPLATGLVESGFGTKDMSIKAKSSNLPPLNGLIPFDQKYGKKGSDPQEVQKFNDKNHHAIEDRVATKVQADIPIERLRMLSDKTGNLAFHGDWIRQDTGEGVMVGKDFGQEFRFWGVKDSGSVKLFEAVSDGSDGWVKGEPVEVMANRDGKAVTADYDLALVAPRLSDVGPEHMSSLKMASFEEVDRRTLTTQRMDERIGGSLREKIDSYLKAQGQTEKSEALEAFKELTPKGLTEIEIKALSAGETSPEELAKEIIFRLAKDEFLSSAVPEALAKNSERYAPSESRLESARDMILEALAPPVGDPLTFSEFNDSFEAITGIDLRADTKYEWIVQNYPNITFDELTLLSNDLGAALENTPSRDTGIVSRFVRDLVPQLNQTVGQTGGREVFHHGDDVGNPYSVEKDNFPMTVILPEGATRGGEPIRVIESSTEFFELAKDLKRQGYAVPVNELWNSNSDLMGVRSDSFTEARDAVAEKFGATVQDMIRLSDINRNL